MIRPGTQFVCQYSFLCVCVSSQHQMDGWRWIKWNDEHTACVVHLSCSCVCVCVSIHSITRDELVFDFFMTNDSSVRLGHSLCGRVVKKSDVEFTFTLLNPRKKIILQFKFVICNRSNLVYLVLPLSPLLKCVILCGMWILNDEMNTNTLSYHWQREPFFSFFHLHLHLHHNILHEQMAKEMVCLTFGPGGSQLNLWHFVNCILHFTSHLCTSRFVFLFVGTGKVSLVSSDAVFPLINYSWRMCSLSLDPLEL